MRFFSTRWSPSSRTTDSTRMEERREESRGERTRPCHSSPHEHPRPHPPVRGSSGVALRSARAWSPRARTSRLVSFRTTGRRAAMLRAGAPRRPRGRGDRATVDGRSPRRVGARAHLRPFFGEQQHALTLAAHRQPFSRFDAIPRGCTRLAADDEDEMSSACFHPESASDVDMRDARLSTERRVKARPEPGSPPRRHSLVASSAAAWTEHMAANRPFRGRDEHLDARSRRVRRRRRTGRSRGATFRLGIDRRRSRRTFQTSRPRPS